MDATTPIAQTEVPTYRAEIFIAGSRTDAARACREFTLRGLCVSVSPGDFIYTGGAETGVRVLLINYPRFPGSRKQIFDVAVELAEFLIVRLCQASASVVADDRTLWLSRRSE